MPSTAFTCRSKPGLPPGGLVPFDGYDNLLKRRFEEAIDIFLAEPLNDAVASALAEAYRRLGFQTLANQVRRSVRSVRGNQWMFRIGHPADQPLRVRAELVPGARACRAKRSSLSSTRRPPCAWTSPTAAGATSSSWAWTFPEGARVLNVSIDLASMGRAERPNRSPPVEAFFRVIDQPILRLVSVDLGAVAEITTLAEVFDFARDYLGLLKAAVIAAGIVPPGVEGSGQSLADLLARMIAPGYGIELVSQVNGIPKGSRLAVSTNLLASLIAVCMRATGQTQALTGQLSEAERRVVAARAILGEWLGGSGGGWQDSGGVWPGMKLIQGVEAGADDPELGISRGRLLPNHTILSADDVSPATRQLLQESLVLVHGGMAQDVGPILEMVTEKYLLRAEAEWQGRLEAIRLFDHITGAAQGGRDPGHRRGHRAQFPRPDPDHHPLGLQPVHRDAHRPRARRVRRRISGASGCWAAWRAAAWASSLPPSGRPRARSGCWPSCRPPSGSWRAPCPLPWSRWSMTLPSTSGAPGPSCAPANRRSCPPATTPSPCPACCATSSAPSRPSGGPSWMPSAPPAAPSQAWPGMVQTLFDRLLPHADPQEARQQSLATLLEENGFDRVQHEQIRADLRSGRIGLAQNRLPVRSKIEDAQPAMCR